MASTIETLIDDLTFGEGPRWRADQQRLWFSDFHDHQVKSASLAGDVRIEVELDDRPSGLGWLPDDRLLVVAMTSRQVLRLEPDGSLVTHADLSEVATWHANDMVVAADGTAYVGNFGFDLDGGAEPVSTSLAMVTPDGSVSVAADDLRFPNGMVITPDTKTLMVGESFGQGYTAFTIMSDGTLTARRQWAHLPGRAPDGCCLDADGNIWMADPLSGNVVLVAEGGEEISEIDIDGTAIAVMLGGPDRRHLFVIIGRLDQPEVLKADRPGRIDVCEVVVAGAGRP
ncbi:MAG TPA: SMP-30/gluconolactonase/LRE family protein [Acidimicrobiales bacterium]